MYLTMVFNHFRAVQQWATASRSDVYLDVKTFELDVRSNQRRFILYPRFVNKHGGKIAYGESLSDFAIGFAGWLPYKSMQWPLSTSKLEFKRFLQERGMRVPRVWSEPAQAEQDFVIKKTEGSFGQAVFGPFHPGAGDLHSQWEENADQDRLLVEQFIFGKILKVWYWGGTPFHVHLDEFSSVTGNGLATIEELISRLSGRVGARLADNPSQAWIMSSLAFQGLDHLTVLPVGDAAWIDFRYNRYHAATVWSNRSDCKLALLSERAQSQARHVGRMLQEELNKQFALPILFSLDGVLDADDNIWWLEANSNPMFPPTGYAPLFATLFDGAFPPALSEMAIPPPAT